MVTGTQIALEFPDNSPPPLISTEEKQIVRDEIPEIPTTVHASPQNLRTLQDLLVAIAATDHHQPNHVAMLRTTAAHLSRYLNQPPDKIEIGTLTDANVVDGFRRYLRDRHFKRNSIRSFVYFAQLFLRKASNLGWSDQSAGVDEEWRRILLTTKRYGCQRVVRSALRMGLKPRTLSDDNLEEIGRLLLEEGLCLQYVLRLKRSFRKCIFESGLSEELPLVSPARPKNEYGIRLSDFPSRLRIQVNKLIEWEVSRIGVDGRTRSSLRPASAKLLVGFCCRLYGFVRNIRRTNPPTLVELLSKRNLLEFGQWFIHKRGAKISSLLPSLSMLSAAAKHYPSLPKRKFRWLGPWLKQLKGQAEDTSDVAKAGKWVDYDQLDRIPDEIRLEAKRAGNKGIKKRASLFRDELLVRFLLTLALRQRNIRECKLASRDKGGNLFKEEVPPMARVTLPKSVADDLKKDPLKKVWQLFYRRDETKGRRPVHIVLPAQLVLFLEEFLEIHRPILVGNSDPGTLFVNDQGRPFDISSLGRRVGQITFRYVGKRVNPHLFRDIVATKWLAAHPEDFLTVSRLLWHRDAKTTEHIYCKNVDESYAASRMEEWLEERSSRVHSNLRSSS